MAEEYGWAVDEAVLIAGKEEWILFRCYPDEDTAVRVAEMLTKQGSKVRVRPAKRPCGPRLKW